MHSGNEDLIPLGKQCVLKAFVVELVAKYNLHVLSADRKRHLTYICTSW